MQLTHEQAYQLVLKKLEGSEIPDAYVKGAFDGPKTEIIQEVIRRMGAPEAAAQNQQAAEGLPYEQYRKIFMTQDRIDASYRRIQAFKAIRR